MNPTTTTTLPLLLLPALLASLISAQDPHQDFESPPFIPGPELTLAEGLAFQNDTLLFEDLLRSESGSRFFEEFNDARNSTILAPNNLALEEYLETDEGRLVQRDSEALWEVLRYHVLNESVVMGGREQGGVETFLEAVANGSGGSSTSFLHVGVFLPAENEIDYAGARFTGGLGRTAGFAEGTERPSPVVSYDNGEIFVIDRVLTIPRDISSTLSVGPFQALSGYLNEYQESNASPSILTAQDITIFAPTDEAFLGVGSILEDIEEASLQRLLLHHAVIGGPFFSSDLEDGQELQTLGNRSLTISISDDADEVYDDGSPVIFINGAKIVAPNLIAVSGVVHGIDQVLNPDAETVEPAEEGTSQVQFEGASAVSSLDVMSEQPTGTSLQGPESPATTAGIESSAGVAVPVVTHAPMLGMLAAAGVLIAAV